ncbi:hypothetical protein A2U01_0000027 [Trifolium medium]|uniref:Transposase (putative) gypsy type domain-containing protein n=1 Tax=Trifolium medium TaxID=97028 RepID=A0A392LWD5_9FABA|nr:hypothetical protein [Trifolium medium]
MADETRAQPPPESEVRRTHANAPVEDGDPDPSTWVADEPLNTPSIWSASYPEGMPEHFFDNVEEEDRNDWKIVFQEMGYRLPFSEFQIAVFDHLELTSSQLHPNSLGFIRAFELTALHFNFEPTVKLFFYIFRLQRSRPKGGERDHFGWVSLKQGERLFDMFEESIRGFKEVYYLVRPITQEGWNNIVDVRPNEDDDGNPVLDANGDVVMANYGCFLFRWKKDHFEYPAKHFSTPKKTLDQEDLDNYQKIKSLAESVPNIIYTDMEGNDLRDKHGELVTKRAFINTKSLLRCRTKEDVAACFQTMSSAAAKMKRMTEAKEKRDKAKVSAAGKSSGSGLPPLAKEKRAWEDDEVVEVQGSTKNARVTGESDLPTPPVVNLSSSITSTNSVTLPHVFGNSKVFHDKTSFKITPAETGILQSMRSIALKNKINAASLSVFKLVEMVHFYNDRECKYLEERDKALEDLNLAKGKLRSLQLEHDNFTEKYRLQEGLMLENGRLIAENDKLKDERKTLDEELKQIKEKLAKAEKELEGCRTKIAELESELKARVGAPQPSIPDASELEIDPDGEYSKMSRAELIAKIFDVESGTLEFAKLAFDNAVAQVKFLNKDLEISTEGLDALKEVKDGELVSPASED